MATPINDIQTQIADVKKQIEPSYRRLQILKEQAARYGGDVPAAVKMEIEDLEKVTLPSLEQNLQRLKQQELAITAKKTKLSDRLASDHPLDRQFRSFKEKWSDVANTIKLLPRLAKDWCEYTDAIDQYASDIIPQDWGSEDVFILCCAIYLHKIGLFPTNRSQITRNVFEQHPRLSKDYILELGAVFDLDPDQRNDIAWVCYGHRNLINEDESIEHTITCKELSDQTKKGRRTRAEIAYYLRILSLLAAFNVSLPGITALLYFMDSTSDYVEYRMNSVVSGFEIRSSLDNVERSVLLKARLSDVELIEDIRFLQKARENLDNAIRDCPNQFQDNFFLNTNVEIDSSTFALQLENKVLTKHFAERLQEATRKSVMALLDSRYGKGNPFLKGWGPMFFYPPGANPVSKTSPETVQEARVANTAEVLLAFAEWLDCADRDDTVVPKVIETINDVLPSLKHVQVKNIASRSSITDPPQDQYNPLASLTFVVPTTRVNSLFVLAGAELLKEMEKYPELNVCQQDVCQIMKDCIDWLCTTSTGPFNEMTINNLPTDYLFQAILAFRALINSKDYWMNLHMGFTYDVVLNKIAEFIHSLLRHRGAEKDWPTVFKAMALEIILFYREQTNERIFDQKPQVERLAKSFIQELLDEVKLDGSLPWKEDNQTLSDEDIMRKRPWTHVTSVWAIEGLTRCMNANLLSLKQKGRLLQTIPMILLRQNGDGFYDSKPHPDDPNVTIHYIFKTALYTYAMLQVQKVLPNP